MILAPEDYERWNSSLKFGSAFSSSIFDIANPRFQRAEDGLPAIWTKDGPQRRIRLSIYAFPHPRRRWMKRTEAHNTPSDVSAEAGEVLVEGPDGIMISFTPEAAAETGHRLQGGAGKAVDQRAGKRPPFDVSAGNPHG
ncbi:hypothetical protein Q4F19_06965 [Sphingomonas sp. BIUV-7]|uniref:Uncharacterized protein n=2 Tax=Sphingomonas natans TaxID=3063330 RepID=A0ABT8Y717_9SPHN|nr:hypothetical protein [Sphingomonas sp. BIUV-7]